MTPYLKRKLWKVTELHIRPRIPKESTTKSKNKNTSSNLIRNLKIPVKWASVFLASLKSQLNSETRYRKKQ